MLSRAAKVRDSTGVCDKLGLGDDFYPVDSSPHKAGSNGRCQSLRVKEVSRDYDPAAGNRQVTEINWIEGH
jgi:hypothetical protein